MITSHWLRELLDLVRYEIHLLLYLVQLVSFKFLHRHEGLRILLQGVESYPPLRCSIWLHFFNVSDACFNLSGHIMKALTIMFDYLISNDSTLSCWGLLSFIVFKILIQMVYCPIFNLLAFTLHMAYLRRVNAEIQSLSIETIKNVGIRWPTRTKFQRLITESINFWNNRLKIHLRTA